MEHAALPHHHSEEHAEHLTDTLSQIDDFTQVSESFRQLGDPTRLRIFWLLCHCEQCVINIAAMMEMSSPAVSHHLKLLRSAGLVVTRRDGKEVFYKAAATPMAELLHHMIEQVMKITCPD